MLPIKHMIILLMPGTATGKDRRSVIRPYPWGNGCYTNTKKKHNNTIILCPDHPYSNGPYEGWGMQNTRMNRRLHYSQHLVNYRIFEVFYGRKTAWWTFTTIQGRVAVWLVVILAGSWGMFYWRVGNLCSRGSNNFWIRWGYFLSI